MDSELSINAAGLAMGKKAFQAFLLAGERYLGSGMKRENSDEARFARFFEEISQQQAGLLEAQFNRQRFLALSQRSLLLGDLVNLPLSRPLNTFTINQPLLLESALRNSFFGVFPDTFLVPPIPPGDGGNGGGGGPSTGTPGVDQVGRRFDQPNAPGSPEPVKIRLHLEELEVKKSQDLLFRVPIIGYRVNDTDEVTLGVIKINEIGETSVEDHDLGEIKHKQKRDFNDKVLCTFDVPSPTSTDKKTLPRIYTARVYAIERDDGGYNEFLHAGAKYIKDKITEEMIAGGVIKAGEGLGIPIPPFVANFIASYVKGFFDAFVDWLNDLFTNADDVLGERGRAVSINSLSTVFRDNNSATSRTFTWDFIGKGGWWRTRMHWTLESKSTPQVVTPA